jgi:hypothetical protein
MDMAKALATNLEPKDLNKRLSVVKIPYRQVYHKSVSQQLSWRLLFDLTTMISALIILPCLFE